MKLFDYTLSGNCYKVRLLLHQLDIEHEVVPVDILRGEGRRPDFLARNPAGQVPVLEISPGVHLTESGAILHYLAEGTPLLPDNRWERARVLRWMFFEQNQLEPTIGTSRFWLSIKREPESRTAELAYWNERGTRALAALDEHLTKRQFVGAEDYTVADIAVYGYVHLAPEGGFDLTPFTAIRRWLEEVRSQPRHCEMRV